MIRATNEAELLQLLERPVPSATSAAPPIGCRATHEIDHDLAQIGLVRGLARYTDIAEIDDLLRRVYPGSDVATEISPYESARTIDFGQVITVRDASGALIGCVYCVPYGPRICYGMRQAVDPAHARRGVGTLLVELLLAACRELGAVAMCALVDAENTPIHHLLLDRAGGAYYDLVLDDVPGVQGHFKAIVPVDRGADRATSGELHAVTGSDWATATALFASGLVAVGTTPAGDLLFARACP